MSWLATTFIGANQIANPDVIKWSKPLFDAFLSGAWMLYWTEDTLYWVSKPVVRVEKVPGGRGRRLHNEHYAALECDIENLYFWHGVLVPAFVVVRPDWITVKHIETEDNAEVRRIMIERYGQSKYLMDSGAVEVQRDDYGILYRKEVAGDEPLVMVKVVNSTPDPCAKCGGVHGDPAAAQTWLDDDTPNPLPEACHCIDPIVVFKDYFLRVAPDCRPLFRNGTKGDKQELTARNAVASTFGLRGEEYDPAMES